MTILPGSLDYLYYNGILDHIPYEAYEMPAIQPSLNNMSGFNQTAAMVNNAKMSGINQIATNSQNINGSAYLDSAKSGVMYNSYSNNDSFVQNSGTYSSNNLYGDTSSLMLENNVVNGGNNIREGGIKQSFKNGLNSISDKFTNAPNIIKGLLSAGIIVGTAILLLRGKFKKH